MPNCTPYTASYYTMGIICALDKELLAVRCLLDSVHPPLRVSRHDSNSYTLGTMGGHNIAATCLPASEYGTNSAASAASQIRMSFPELEFCLLVGIAGGIPGKEDIRLRDVVVSLPIGTRSGVVQHDMGKSTPDVCFVETGSLQRPPRVLLGGISSLRSNPHLASNPLREFVEIISRLKPAYSFPGRVNDLLFQPNCVHDTSDATCDGQVNCQVPRTPRGTNHPYIHYGLIGSGNKVVKDAVLRDQLAKKYNILCLEMEAAGILNVLPCLVIRGICDYSDSHKSKVWQEYAAATAAAYPKLLLIDIRAYGPFGHIAPVALDYTEASNASEPPNGRASASDGQSDRLPRHPARPLQRLEDIIKSPVAVPSGQLIDVKPSLCSALQAPRMPRSATDILKKAESYAERRGLWNDVPSDTTPLIAALKEWAETRSSDVLVLEPQGPSAEPRADDLAFEVISLLKSQSQPIHWILSPAFADPLTEHDIVHCLAEQLGGSFNHSDTTINLQELLSGMIPQALDDIGKFFFVLAVKHLSLTLSLLEILKAIQVKPGRTVKIIMVGYSPLYHQATEMLPSASVHHIRPAQPNPKRRRTQTRWRERVHAQIQPDSCR
ncbi:nucleoside phosphorylase domain-containing protein [Aspergillus karnatakaensis]|uniref:nucleoside phosphorylase domain-containing protein n=1 Tax=Aspergillus karnatakaensis TaxID=1810916 RepID=UPI003CCDEC4A